MKPHNGGTSTTEYSKNRHRQSTLSERLDEHRIKVTVRRWHKREKKEARRHRFSQMLQKIPHAGFIGEALYMMGFWTEYAVINAGRAVLRVAIAILSFTGTLLMLILRPLAGLDKLESIERAEKIGTYDISIEPFPDSCTVFAPPSPAVAAKFYLVEEEERKIPNLEEELEKAFHSIEKHEDL